MVDWAMADRSITTTLPIVHRWPTRRSATTTIPFNYKWPTRRSATTYTWFSNIGRHVGRPLHLPAPHYLNDVNLNYLHRLYKSSSFQFNMSNNY